MGLTKKWVKKGRQVMNRAASFLWATTVALVLSTSACAEKGCSISHTSQDDRHRLKVAGAAETVDVPTQVIRNRAATRPSSVAPPCRLSDST